MRSTFVWKLKNDFFKVNTSKKVFINEKTTEDGRNSEKGGGDENRVDEEKRKKRRMDADGDTSMGLRDGPLDRARKRTDGPVVI